MQCSITVQHMHNLSRKFCSTLLAKSESPKTSFRARRLKSNIRKTEEYKEGYLDLQPYQDQLSNFCI